MIASPHASLIGKNIGPAFGSLSTRAVFRSHLFAGRHPRPSFEAIGWICPLLKNAHGALLSDGGSIGRSRNLREHSFTPFNVNWLAGMSR
ncbi:hypothetical protein PUN28_010590 [Cardiocondyla obscurior]|uniref:Uncharacterized protein n=1 Tax=Cardiocondyla obscurior TaxID=286306 RepID=A0AAW2FMG1_9HYME